jgi:hypothetical protein
MPQNAVSRIPDKPTQTPTFPTMINTQG